MSHLLATNCSQLIVITLKAISSIAAAGCDSLGAGAAVRSATKVKKCISCRKTFSLFRRRLKCERCCKASIRMAFDLCRPQIIRL